MLTPWFFPVTALLFGVVVGSFLNVVIHRLPRDESLAFPASHCPLCEAAIPPWHNIPVLSWFILAGRCRSCGGPISLRYPFVEAANGLLWALLASRFGPSFPFALWALYCSALVAVIFIDIDHLIIPHEITRPGMVLGLAASFWVPREAGLAAFIAHLAGLGPLSPGLLYLLDSFAAFLFGGLFFYGAAWFSLAVFRKEGMGGGDINLTAMMGAFLGLERLIVAIFLALLSGSAVSILMIAAGRKTRKDVIPFGPFLALGGMAALLWGEAVLDWYLSVSALR